LRCDVDVMMRSIDAALKKNSFWKVKQIPLGYTIKHFEPASFLCVTSGDKGWLCHMNETTRKVLQRNNSPFVLLQLFHTPAVTLN
jgi:hypothetical protein